MLSSCTRWHFVGCWLLTTAITNSAWNKSPPQGDKLIIFAPTAPQLAASCSFLPKTAVSQLTATCPPASFVPQKCFLPPMCVYTAILPSAVCAGFEVCAEPQAQWLLPRRASGLGHVGTNTSLQPLLADLSPCPGSTQSLARALPAHISLLAAPSCCSPPWLLASSFVTPLFRMGKQISPS